MSPPATKKSAPAKVARPSSRRLKAPADLPPKPPWDESKFRDAMVKATNSRMSREVAIRAIEKRRELAISVFEKALEIGLTSLLNEHLSADERREEADLLEAVISLGVSEATALLKK